MAGKIILLCLLVLIAAVLLIPAVVRVSYDRGELALSIRFGPVRRQLFPPPEVKAPGEKDRPKKKKQPEAEKKEKNKKKPGAGINMEQVLYSLETLPPVLGRALRRTGKRVRICPLKVHLLVAGGDPADTAMLYGRLEAALGAGLPLLHRVLHIREQDIRLFLDFSAERMDCIADIGIALRPWDLISVGVRAGGSLLKWFIGFKKLASPPPVQAKEEGSAKGAETAGGQNHEAA